MSHLNLEQINNLIDAAGVDNTKDILDAFWRSTESLMIELQAQLTGGDFSNARNSAHAIKGSAANIGASTVQEVAMTIENACKSQGNDLEVMLQSEIDKLYENFEEARKAFSNHLENYYSN